MSARHLSSRSSRTSSFSRRSFLAASSAAMAGVTAQMGFLKGLPRVSAEEAKPDPKIVRLSDEIEPLVRLVEETPREKLLEEVAAKIKKGTSYREVVAALLLAGVRNVQPRPLGFKFHAVLVVNSAHLASMSSPDDQRWLPIFWALDHFKDAQAKDVSEGNWTMAPVDEAALPPAHLARQMFIDAMDQWDEAKADVAVAALARTAGSNELFELFCRYGARDFRSIGHKAIYVANAWRTLNCIGWQHAEPVLRSLAYGLLIREGNANPATSDLAPDRPMRENLSLIKTIRPEWQEGKLDSKATEELLATLHTGSASDATKQVAEMLNRGVSPQSIWDALFLGSGECLMRQPGIVGLHTLTTSNALRYAYDTTGSDETRRLLLLQNAAFVPLFRQAMESRGKVEELKIGELQPLEVAAKGELLDNVFAEISKDKQNAARLTLSYALHHDDAKEFIQRARVLVFLKGRDAHDYKFSSAVLEDFRNVSPDWRGKFLASSVYNLRGSGGNDNPVAQRTKQALA
jgi:hypothetical protein